MYDVIVVGAGPCGVMSAIQASKRGLSVLLIDHNKEILEKFKISGNKRCNITNNKDIKDFLNHFDNGKFFYGLTKNFTPQAIMEYFTNLGVNLKEEDHNRIFPTSNKSSSFIKVLKKELSNVSIHCQEDVLKVSYDNKFIITTNHDTYNSSNLVLATGGKTWPSLGTNEHNYQLVKSFNHTITPLTPQECPIKIKEPITELMGLSLTTTIKIMDNDKVIKSLDGDLLFTHFGLSGPVILDASMAITSLKDKAVISLELIGNYECSKEYIYQLINNNPTRLLKNLLKERLPNRLVEYLLNKIGIINIKNADLKKNQIKELIHLLTNFKMKFKSFYQPENAFLTGGGVKLSEVNKKNLESKLVNKLYLGGELLDICGSMGGYNISMALICGYNIGQAIEKEI